MAWTTPKTWTAVTLPASDLNTYVRDNTNYLKDAADAEYPLDVITADTEVVNTVTKTALWTFTVPANMLGSNNLLELEIWLSILNNTGSTYVATLGLEYGGTAIVALAPSITTGAVRNVLKYTAMLKGNAATNAQRALVHVSGYDPNNFTIMRSGEGTATVDSTAGQTFVLYTTNGVAHASFSVILRSARLNYYKAL